MSWRLAQAALKIVDLPGKLVNAIPQGNRESQGDKSNHIDPFPMGRPRRARVAPTTPQIRSALGV